MYLSIDPIATRTIPPRKPEPQQATNPEDQDPLGRAAIRSGKPPILITIPLIRQQNGCPKAPLGYG
jgi:hypothetical protein